MSAADRHLLWGAASLALLLLAATVAFAPGAAQQGAEAPSTYASDSGGALAAYLLLLDLHYPVRRWEQPPLDLPADGRGSLLILAEPTETAGRPDRDALQKFVSGGGRVLFCGGAVRSFFPQALVSANSFDPEWREFPASFPSYLSRDAATVVMRPQAYWRGRDPEQVRVYGGRDTAAVVAWRMGQGQVLWWAGATPLTNGGLRSGGNLRLFLNSIAPPGQPPSAIYWDEYFHGQRGSLWSYIAATPMVFAIPQLILLVAAVLFTYSRRSGPVVTAAPVSRLAPLEFVDTMGGLYRRAHAGSIAVATSWQRLRRELARRLNLPAAAPDVELAQAAGARLGMTGLEESLRSAARAAGQEKLSERAALRLVQELEGYTVQLTTPKKWNSSPR